MTRSSQDRRTGTALALASVSSVQFGAAVAAAKLFPVVGPFGAVSLRSAGAAIVLGTALRLWRVSWTRRQLRNSALLGVVLTVMNLSLYSALQRLPLATVITVEYLGPLGVALATATSWRTRIWAAPAAAGVLLLGGSLSITDLLGVACALLAAGMWACYILLNARLGGADTGLAGLGLATAASAVVMLPVGVLAAGPALLHPGPLGWGLLVGVLAGAIPYSFDLLALRRLPTAAFGVLTSLNPAVAALAGLLVLGEHLPALHLVGIAAVMAASVGVTVTPARRGRTATAAAASGVPATPGSPMPQRRP